MFQNQAKRSRFTKLTNRRLNEVPPETEGTVTPTETAPTEDVTALKSTLAKERDARKAQEAYAKQLKADLAALAAKSISLDEYNKIVAEREAQEQAVAAQKAIEEKLNSEKKTLTDRHSKELAAKEQALASMQSEYSKLELTTALKEAFFSADGNPKTGEDGISHFKLFTMLQDGKFALNDAKQLVVMGEDGQPKMSIADPTKEMQPEEYIRSLHTHPVLGNCFVVKNPPTGTGANHTSTAPPKKEATDLKKMSIQERAMHIAKKRGEA